MTIERMFNNSLLNPRSTVIVFDEGVLLYRGDLGGAPLDLLNREIAEVDIRYKNRSPVEATVRLVHYEEKKLTVRRLFQHEMHPHTYITLVNRGVTVYVGYYYDLPRCFLGRSVKNYYWVVGESQGIVVEIH